MCTDQSLQKFKLFQTKEVSYFEPLIVSPDMMTVSNRCSWLQLINQLKMFSIAVFMFFLFVFFCGKCKNVAYRLDGDKIKATTTFPKIACKSIAKYILK